MTDIQDYYDPAYEKTIRSLQDDIELLRFIINDIERVQANVDYAAHSHPFGTHPAVDELYSDAMHYLSEIHLITQ